MKSIQEQFDPGDVAVFASQRATPAAYLASNPAQFSYIHFVSHAVASSTDPLDSAIILSASSAGEDSFKLYARDIMQHPIEARLVTISSCYGSGTRSYAGEGLVGLSWAFLRAGSHSVIGALWEVSDDSSPRLMNTLYQGLKEGETPAAALRLGKLALLHQQIRFRAPFYWAPFQIYTR
jgi:CHAT domain-containing protein